MTATVEPHPSDITQVQKITWLSLFANLVLSGLKFVAGYLGNSQVLIADAVHSSSDMATDVVVLIGSRFWGLPADEGHPHGHAKIETLVTLMIGLALGLVGVKLIYSSIDKIDQMIVHDQQILLPGGIALAAAIVSILVKEWLYRITVRTGLRAHSSATVANAWHHRSDAMSSIPAALAVGGTMVLGEKFAFLDPLGTVVVSFMILYTAWDIMHPTFRTLLDASAGENTTNAIREKLMENPAIADVHKIRTRPLGSSLYSVDLHVKVDGNMNVTQAHHLSHQIQSTIIDLNLQIVEVTVHVEPLDK